MARDQALARLGQKLDLMQALGARTLLVGTSTHPDATGDQDRISADLAELALRSGARGCRAALQSNANQRALEEPRHLLTVQTSKPRLHVIGAEY